MNDKAKQLFQPIEVSNDPEAIALNHLSFDFSQNDLTLKAAIKGCMEAHAATGNELKGKVQEIWEILSKRYGLDLKRHKYNIVSNPNTGDILIQYEGKREEDE